MNRPGRRCSLPCPSADREGGASPRLWASSVPTSLGVEADGAKRLWAAAQQPEPWGATEARRPRRRNRPERQTRVLWRTLAPSRWVHWPRSARRMRCWWCSARGGTPSQGDTAPATAQRPPAAREQPRQRPARRAAAAAGHRPRRRRGPRVWHAPIPAGRATRGGHRLGMDPRRCVAPAWEAALDQADSAYARRRPQAARDLRPADRHWISCRRRSWRRAPWP